VHAPNGAPGGRRPASSILSCRDRSLSDPDSDERNRMAVAAIGELKCVAQALYEKSPEGRSVLEA
jgi:hypothetical protein